MTERERKAVLALVYMARQYLQRSPDEEWIDGRAMSAADAAISALAEYGLMTLGGKGRLFGKWNVDAVRAFEASAGT